MLAPLSEREEQVLKQIALGYTHKEIAGLLSISEKTVDTYRARILEKTKLRSRAEIVRCAIAVGSFCAHPDTHEWFSAASKGPFKPLT